MTIEEIGKGTGSAGLQPKKEYDERYRPQFHFTARKNWLNDPNGLVFYKGEYHLFFQYNPSGLLWGNMTWGHAVSPDLVHWKQLDEAIHPDELGAVYSGSAVVDWNNTAGFQEGDEKTLVCIYTSAGIRSVQSIAYSTDCGRSFTKFGRNPVLPEKSDQNRDPKVVWHHASKMWIMVLYMTGNEFAFFSSPDLKSWTQLQAINVPGCIECPDFFEMPVDGDRENMRWVWTGAGGEYLIGQFDGRRFTYDAELLRSDHGANFYAVQSFSDIPDEDGRRIQIAWMRNGKYPEMPFNQQMSFPCTLELRKTPEGLRLCRMPVKEIESLYAETRSWQDLILDGEEHNPLCDVTGELFDIEAVFEPRDAEEAGIRLHDAAIVFAKNRISCLGQSSELSPVSGAVKLRILVDRTSVEVFGNDGVVSMTSCFLPANLTTGLQLYAKGGKSVMRSLTIRKLRSAWSGNL